MASDPSIGTRIAKRRQVLGITQEELAHELQRLTGRPVSKSTVANWERGKHYPQRYLGALEEVLGIPLEGDTGPETDPVEDRLRAVEMDPYIEEIVIRAYREARRTQRAAG